MKIQEMKTLNKSVTYVLKLNTFKAKTENTPIIENSRQGLTLSKDAAL